MLQIYKSFIRPHLDYCDVIYHKPTYDDFYNKYYVERAKFDPVKTNYHFTNTIEAVQYNAALDITGCVRGTSREKISSELGIFTDFLFFYKIVNQLTPEYLRHFIPDSKLQITHTNRANTNSKIHI